jgi:hypothetical protein
MTGMLNWPISGSMAAGFSGCPLFFLAAPKLTVTLLSAPCTTDGKLPRTPQIASTPVKNR